MTDSELNDLLKSARVPEKSADYWKKFSGQVMEQIELRQRRSADVPLCFVASRSRRPWFSFLRNPALGFGLAILCLTLIVAVRLSHKSGSIAQTSAQQLWEAQKYYREIEPLFHNQLEAIVLDQSGPRLVLAKEPTVPNSPPLYVKICGSDYCQRFITFSGQHIQFNGESCEVLADHEGNVMLVGRRLLWSGSAAGGKTGNYRIEAKTLSSTS